MGDHERVLTPQGVKDAGSLGMFMREKNLRPDFALSSSATRTMQTTRLVFDALLQEDGAKIDSHFDRKLYLAAADILLLEIQAMNDDIGALLVVAHNPGVAELTLELSQKAIADYTNDFAPGTMAAFTANIKRWAELSPANMVLETVFVP
jgi:phosphohistidine phosphatase